MGPKKQTTKTTQRTHEELASEAAAVWVERTALHAWDKNPRKNEKAIPKVMESIKRFGFGSPILARKNGEIIAGHTRWAAAEALGLDRVPVRYLDLDPAEAHLLALADNKLGEVADWADDVLGSVLSEYGLEDVALAGWDSSELEKLGDTAIEDIREEAEEYSEKFQVIVNAGGEVEQAQLYERLTAEGYVCQLLTL